jgi:hypothetical protein
MPMEAAGLSQPTPQEFVLSGFWTARGIGPIEHQYAARVRTFNHSHHYRGALRLCLRSADRDDGGDRGTRRHAHAWHRANGAVGSAQDHRVASRVAAANGVCGLSRCVRPCSWRKRSSVDTPARMLAPLILAVIENGGAFRAVVLTPSVAAGDLRLDTEIMRLEHDFVDQPSRVRFTLRAYVVDDATRRVIAWREFVETVAATSEARRRGGCCQSRGADRVGKTCELLCRSGRILAASNAETLKRAEGRPRGR